MIWPRATFPTFFSCTHLPGNCVRPLIHACLKSHSSVLNLMANVLFHTKLLLTGTSSPSPYATLYPLPPSNLLSKPLSSLDPACFIPLFALCCVGVCVRVCVYSCVCVRVRVCVLHVSCRTIAFVVRMYYACCLNVLGFVDVHVYSCCIYCTEL